MKIRRGVPSDADSLAMLRRLWRLESRDTPLTAEPEFEKRFSDWMDRELARGSVIWVAAEDRPIGMLLMFIHDRMPDPDRPQSQWGYIGNVFVMAQYRDAGVGRALLDQAIEYARSHGLARLILNPNIRAAHLYRRAGFVDDNALMTLDLE